MNSNPRMTAFISNSKDQDIITKITYDFGNNQNATLHWVLCKFIECNLINQQPDFLKILFQDHTNLVIEMFEWMLIPKVIAQRKKIKSNLDFFPYRCKEFIKDNIFFYENLYLLALSNKLPLHSWFKFLRKQFYDEQTVLMALGYFSEALVPFAKYQFSSSINISQSYGQNLTVSQQQTLSIMKILPKQLIAELIQWQNYQAIFLFLKTAILVSIEDNQDYQICASTMKQMLIHPQISNIFFKLSTALQPKQSQNITNKIDQLQNICQSLKQLIANIQPTNSDMQLRLELFISIILKSQLIPYTINQITKSKLCNGGVIAKQKQKTDLSSSQQIVVNRQTNPSINLFSSQGAISFPCHSKNFILDQYEQDQLMEILLKILTYCVEIFVRIPKTVGCQQQLKPNIFKLDRAEKYKNLVIAFHEQMQNLLDNLEKMIKIVYSQQDLNSSVNSKFIPFSSGQKIKTITFMKFQFLKLLHNCLIMIQCPENFQAKLQKLQSVRKLKSIVVNPYEIKIQKLHIIEIIQKYLSENRWNNIVHHCLQKICHSLIICSYDYLRKNIEKGLNKKQTQSFLSFLIQNFTQRHYIFLNTFKFTTQGNLQSIYNISKDLAYTLNSTNQLVILLNEFQPWKKFIMNDLKLYEQKTYPLSIKPDPKQQSEQQCQIDISGLKVDEVDSIRKLIQNISTTKKWPTKISKKKSNSHSGIIRKSDQQADNEQSENLSRSNQFHTHHLHKRKQPIKKTLDDLLKKKVQYSIQFQGDHQVQQVDVQQISVRERLSQQKANGQDQRQSDLYAVFKNIAKNNDNKY